MTRDELAVEVEKFMRTQIQSVMDWYIRGDAVDCKETRANIHKDLDWVLRETEKKFRLKPFKRVLRVRTETPGIFKVRWEERDLS